MISNFKFMIYAQNAAAKLQKKIHICKYKMRTKRFFLPKWHKKCARTCVYEKILVILRPILIWLSVAYNKRYAKYT